MATPYASVVVGGPDCAPCAISNAGAPGGPGIPGQPGTNGTDGINAYSTTTLGFTVPAIGSSVAIAVDESAWIAAGQAVYIQNAGYYTASATGLLAITATNTGNGSNASAGTVIALGQVISPSGPQGASGALTGTAGGDLTGTYPNPTIAAVGGLTAGTSTKITYNTKGQVTAGTTLVAADIPSLDASILTTGLLPISRGGTSQGTQTSAFNALSPLTTKGDIPVFSAGNNVRLPVGADGSTLIADSTQTPGLKWGTAPTFTTEFFNNTNVSTTPYTQLANDVIMGYKVATTPGTVTLLTSPADGRLAIVKDRTGAAGTYNITITAGSGDTIEGSATMVISTNYGVRFLYYDLADKVWYRISSL